MVLTVNFVSTLKPTLLNEFKFGWTRIKIGILNCGVEGACGINPNYSADIGIPKTTEVVMSWAIVKAPLSRIASNPLVPSEPIPVIITPIEAAPNVSATALKR